MKLQQLRFFTAVYEEGSFSAGAARMNATQSGLSMQVRELEERFGVQLLIRSSTGVQPTEAGRRFYAQVVKVLRASSEAEEVLRRAAGATSGQVRIGLMPTFTRAVLTPALLEFTRSHELVRVSVLEAYSSQLCEEVAKGTIDFAVVPAIDGMLQVQATPMGTDREYLVSSPSHGPTHLSPVCLRDLHPLKLVLPSRANARRMRIESYLAANGIEVDDILELDAMLGTLDLVSSSDWMAILPGILCAPDVHGQNRTLNPIEGPLLTVDYAMIEPNDQTLSQAARAFASILQIQLDRTLLWNPAAAI